METKPLVKSLSQLGDLIQSVYRRLVPDKESPTFWINKYLANTSLTIVQIGSNDGVSGDPIFKLVKKNTNWQVLFVEPVPYLFDRLKKNYTQDSRFLFENAAINDGTNQVFYSVSEDANNYIANLPPWYDQLGSFNRGNIVHHLDGILEPYIIATDVNGLTLSQLLTKNKINRLDLLHIDTEGYDYKILSQLDLKTYNPTLILFEYVHLQDAEKAEALTFLKESYHIFRFRGDFLCFAKTKMSERDFTTLKEKLITE
ncbi:FkbM family methyltransferase [Fibrella aquatilis]|uniref:FkbM family methyltransferase n=1 Tax=Fibrella aquatilis TaxID=2817059 RepID=A0A939JWJ7_9BACT|nr:FkbM family methyltransferase [Fibrella aquatilis]MBO0930069.1 FkbM family methyltransferase [Fibrella aquatilis]